MSETKNSYATILKNSLANYCGFFISLAIAFFLSPFLVHTLGDTRYGIWSIAASLSGYMSLLDMGISSSLTRYVAKYKTLNKEDTLNSIISSACFLLLLCSSSVIALSPLVSYLIVTYLQFDATLVKIVQTLIIIISFDVALFLAAGTFRGIFQGLQRYDITNIAHIITSISNAALFYIFLTRGYGLITMGLISISGKTITITIFTLLIKKKFTFINISWKSVSRKSIRTIFSHSTFSFINIVASQIAYYSDTFVIGFFINAATITYYSIAWSLTEYIKKFCISFTNVFIPAASAYDAAKDGYDQIRQLLYSGTKYALVFIGLFCVGLMILGGPFIDCWMGDIYGQKSRPILFLFTISHFFVLPQLISQSILMGMTRHQIVAYGNLVVSFVNLTLSILLVQKYGMVGVAIGTTIPQMILSGLIVPYQTCKIIETSPFHFFQMTYGKVAIPIIILLGSLIMLGNFIKPTSFLLIFSEAIACALVYFLSVFLFSLDGSERETAKATMKKFTSKLPGVQ